jgi:hypothetical protein
VREAIERIRDGLKTGEILSKRKRKKTKVKNRRYTINDM